MKKKIQRADQRGHFENEWLNTYFSFSFSEYYNSERMSFGALRVLNDDVIQGNNGFGSHPHKDMEIITIPFSGTLSHKDSTGSTGEIQAGEIQVMSAGSGITHSEFNNHEEEVRLFQIWIHTKEKGITPRHATKKVNLLDNDITLIVSGEKSDETLYIHQDAKISLGKCDNQKNFTYDVGPNNGVFVMVIEGKLIVEGEELHRKDSIEIPNSGTISLSSHNSYFVIIEVPMNV